jgi:broad specificity phosphatase PhoE
VVPNPRPSVLLLLRHGQSEWNATGRWQGQADPPLTATGRQQAIEAGARLRRDGLRFDHILASDLTRAATTARFLATELGHKRRGSIDVELMPALRERHAGPFQGLTQSEIETQFPGALSNREWPNGYERDDQIIARLIPALGNLARNRPGKRLLAVAHGGLIRALDRYLSAEERPINNLSGRWYELSANPTALAPIQLIGLKDQNTVE